MNKAVKLSKLEALLARIRMRADQPRRSPATPSVGSVSAVLREEALPAITSSAVVAFAREAVISTAPPTSPPVDESTLPPPPPQAPSDQEFAVEVDMSEATAEPLDVMDTRAQEFDSRGPSASQERLAVADSSPPQSIPPAAAANGETSATSSEGLADDESLSADEGEEMEEAPVSSRRAVVSPPEERLAQLAFGADEPPQRHTPPPKSGPLPAPPVVELEADTTGVRKAEILSSEETSPSFAPSVLVPQATRPGRASSTDVVDVIGEAQRFSPETFVALLDASLAL